ncbi:MAG: dihydrolipoyl dehydrogenase [Phycisphaerae bacterium]
MAQTTSQYDVAVLGGGPGGYAAALRAAQRGAKVCCIEARRLGGTCLNVGCIPTKAMLHASDLYWHFRHGGDFGFTGAQPALDGAAYMRRVTRVVDTVVNGLAGLMKARKIDVINGRGRLISGNEIAVEPGGAKPTDGQSTIHNPQSTMVVAAKSIILATGSRPARPAMFPWHSPRVFTTDEATVADRLPESVIVVGGGVIGCEFATIYSELGVKTAVVEMLDRLLNGLDVDASRGVTRSLRDRGVEILTGRRIVKMEATAGGVMAELDGGPWLEAAGALVAVGRRPNVEDIGLEKAGVAVEGGLVKVDDHCRTNVDGIYAVGDMAVAMQYAHLATRMGLVAADNAAGREVSDDRSVVPVGVYTHPEVAAVGLGEEDARKACPDLRVSRFPYTASGMAQAYGETEGLVKLMADGASGAILGGLVIGQHATDVIQELAVAMRNKLTVEQVAGTIHPHPTFAEAVGEAAEAWLGLPLHILR